MVGDIEDIKANIDHCVETKQIYKLRHWIKELRYVAGDDAVAGILNANATPMMYSDEAIDARD
jgi:hypothetical protein